MPTTKGSTASLPKGEVGRWVNYHGSLDDHWGRYRIASVSETVDGPRYQLADAQDQITLTRVSRNSFTLIPDGPPHHVRHLRRRLRAVRRAAHLRYGDPLPELLDTSIRRVPEVVAANRHAEAEHYLLSLEATVGCISHEDFQQRVQKIVITTSDDSWSPWPQEPTPTHAPTVPAALAGAE